MLYQCYLEEMETSGTRASETLSYESYNRITQKLCAKGLQCTLHKVKDKVRAAKWSYQAWESSHGGNNSEGWKVILHLIKSLVISNKYLIYSNIFRIVIINLKNLKMDPRNFWSYSKQCLGQMKYAF